MAYKLTPVQKAFLADAIANGGDIVRRHSGIFGGGAYFFVPATRHTVKERTGESMRERGWIEHVVMEGSGNTKPYLDSERRQIGYCYRVTERARQTIGQS